MNWDHGCATIVLVSFVGVDSFVQGDSVLALKSFTLKLFQLSFQPALLPLYLPASLVPASNYDLLIVVLTGWG